jgi:hypothetical protein
LLIFSADRHLWRRTGSNAPVLGGIWKRPDTTGLDQDVTAEVLLCAGILTSWAGGQNQITEAHDWTEDLLNESIPIYGEAGRVF